MAFSPTHAMFAMAVFSRVRSEYGFQIFEEARRQRFGVHINCTAPTGQK